MKAERQSVVGGLYSEAPTRSTEAEVVYLVRCRRVRARLSIVLLRQPHLAIGAPQGSEDESSVGLFPYVHELRECSGAITAGRLFRMQ